MLTTLGGSSAEAPAGVGDFARTRRPGGCPHTRQTNKYALPALRANSSGAPDARGLRLNISTSRQNKQAALDARGLRLIIANKQILSKQAQGRKSVQHFLRTSNLRFTLCKIYDSSSFLIRRRSPSIRSDSYNTLLTTTTEGTTAAW